MTFVPRLRPLSTFFDVLAPASFLPRSSRNLPSGLLSSFTAMRIAGGAGAGEGRAKGGEE